VLGGCNLLKDDSKSGKLVVIENNAEAVRGKLAVKIVFRLDSGTGSAFS
jgi:hypothetical protein